MRGSQLIGLSLVTRHRGAILDMREAVGGKLLNSRMQRVVHVGPNGRPCRKKPRIRPRGTAGLLRSRERMGPRSQGVRPVACSMVKP